MNKLLLLILLSTGAFAQQSIVKAPRDSTGSMLATGLGLPYLIEPTVTVTSYINTSSTALSSIGADTGRQYRHLSIYNPSGTLSIYVCVGNATSCSTDMWKAPPGIGVVDDFAYFGLGNNVTNLYYRLSGAGSVVPIIRWW